MTTYSNHDQVEAILSLNGFQELKAGPDGENVRWTCDPTVELPVKVNRDPEHAASLPPTTVIQVFKDTVAAKPNFPALRVERNGKWVQWDFLTYYTQACDFAKSLITIGYQPHEVINIIGFNSPEWFIADVGAIFAGGIAAGIYTSNGPEACFYVANHSQARVMVVEDEKQLQKILEIRDRLPNLLAIVQYVGTPPSGLENVYGWQEFMNLGRELADSELEARMSAQRPGHCCTLIYTSGTTGNPKAVMLSHDNITWTAQMCNRSFQTNDRERVISYLPLSHIAAQLTELHAPLKLGGCVFFARPDALQGTLVQTLQAVRPTIFFGVPRVWEKIEEKMRAVGAGNSGLKKQLGDWAKDVGLRANLALLEGKETPWGFTLADKLVFHNVKKALGLEEARILMTGAAPIALKTLHYFLSLNMPVRELYGMSESTGPGTWNREGETKVGSVGKCMMGAEIAIAHQDQDGQGEILMRGRHVFMGYMNNPEATRKDIDEMGYLHSGDLGKIDSDGYLYITGRIKELIITKGGENIPPILIEDAVKGACNAISYAVLIGDQRKFLSMLLTIKSEPDADGKPTDQLSGPAMEWAKSVGSSVTTITAAATDQAFLAGVQEAIDGVNAKATSRAQRVQKWTILTNEFTEETGELTPTVKLKRPVVAKKYADVIEAFYSEDIRARL